MRARQIRKFQVFVPEFIVAGQTASADLGRGEVERLVHCEPHHRLCPISWHATVLDNVECTRGRVAAVGQTIGAALGRLAPEA